jgi:hypothetical protein
MTTKEECTMSKRQTVIGLIACASIAAGCGGGDDGDSGARSNDKAKAVDIAARAAQLEKNPYDLRCSDLSDAVASARMTRVVQYALADDAKIRGLNRLQASQSIYFAITELCKSKPGSYRPAKDAIAAVRSGELRAEL